MICLKCEKEMKVRSGAFGEFYFCPNQKFCGQPTLSKSSGYANSSREELNHASQACRKLEVKMFGHELGVIVNESIDPSRPFDPETDDNYFNDDDGYCGAF